MDAKAKRAAEIQQAIRRVLRDDWNPIGFDDLPDDEYDSYIAPVYRILTGNRSEQDLVDYLFRTETETIGLACELPEQLRPIARKLLELDVRMS